MQTNQRAEIRAAVRALEAAKLLLLDVISVRRVVLVCDSHYVVQGMTEYVFRWLENGWKTAGGRTVVNAPDFRELNELIEKLEEEGINIEFWKVGREDNTQADSLAKAACT